MPATAGDGFCGLAKNVRRQGLRGLDDLSTATRLRNHERQRKDAYGLRQAPACVKAEEQEHHVLAA